MIHDAGTALTPRQIEIITLYAQGLNRAEIAERLFIAPDTVKTHLWRIFAKLGARNGRHAIALTHDLYPRYRASGYLAPRERAAVHP